MGGFLKIYDDMIKKLDRPLQKEEIDFLEWMRECYNEEQESKHVSVLGD